MGRAGILRQACLTDADAAGKVYSQGEQVRACCKQRGRVPFGGEEHCRECGCQRTRARHGDEEEECHRGETASSLAKVVEKSDKSKKRVSLGGEAAATLKEAAEKQAVVEDRRRSFGKSTEPPKSAMKEHGNALFNSPGAEDEKSPTTISMNAMTPAKSVIFTANQAVVFEATPSPMNATATVNAGCESVGPSGPSGV